MHKHTDKLDTVRSIGVYVNELVEIHIFSSSVC